MKIKVLTNEERRICFGKYRNNDLFRHFYPILSEVERVVTGVDAISLWYNAEHVLQNLRSVVGYRDTEINFLFDEMARENDAKVLTTVMYLVFIRLANAAKTGSERTPNDSICMAILKLYIDDTLFRKLYELSFKNKLGNDGKRVVIAPFDPMTQDMNLNEMDGVVKKEVEDYINKVMEITQGLKLYFKEWDDWKLLWEKICLDVELLSLLKEINPRNNQNGFNMKMVCNVIGMYAEAKLINVPKMSLNNALNVKNMRNYISNHCNYNTTDTPLSKEQHEKIEKMIQ